MHLKEEVMRLQLPFVLGCLWARFLFDLVLMQANVDPALLKEDWNLEALCAKVKQ